MQVRYQMTPSDVTRVLWSIGVWRRWLILLLSCAPSLVLVAWSADWFALAVCFILVIGLTWVAIRAALQVSRAVDEKILRPTTVTLHRDFVQLNSDMVWWRRRWSAIRSVGMNSYFVLIYLDPTNVLTIPRRSFDSHEHANEFVELARRCFDQRSREDGREPTVQDLILGNPWCEELPPAIASYQMTVEEIAQVEFRGIEEGVKYARPWIIWRFLVGIGLTLLVAPGLAEPGDDWLASFSKVALFVVVSGWWFLTFVRTMERMWIGGYDTSLLRWIDVAVTPDVLMTSGGHGVSLVRWEALDTVQLFPQFVAVMFNPAIRCLVVPARAFEDEAELSRFANRMLSCVEESHSGKDPPVRETNNPYQAPDQ